MSSDNRSSLEVEDKRPSSPYAGRWIARLRGKVIAHGGTPEQARRAAQGCRHKEIPEIVFEPTSEPLPLNPLVNKVLEILPPSQVIYLVGGAVRDAFLGVVTHEMDFIVPNSGIVVGKNVAHELGADFFPLDDKRNIGRVILNQDGGIHNVLDFSSYRGADLEADLVGRDFTINAIALDLRTQFIYDPLGGAVDLREKRLRPCSTTSFNDDPVRILRAVRQAAAYDLRILHSTRQSMKQVAELLVNVSPERIRDELFRILEGPHPNRSLKALDLLGVLNVLLPELIPLKGFKQPSPHVNDIWVHTLGVLNHLESLFDALAFHCDPASIDDFYTGLLVKQLGCFRHQFVDHFSAFHKYDRSIRSLLFFSALYHDVAKPLTRIIDENGQMRFWDHDFIGSEIASNRARALHLSNDEIKRVMTVVRNHMRVHFHTNQLIKENKKPSRRAIYRLFHDTGEAGVDIILLALADIRATYEFTLSQDTWIAGLEVCRIFLENWWEKPEETVSPPVLVNGNDLIQELNLTPGPTIGQLLEAVRESQATGKINTRDEALDFGRQWLIKRDSEM
jgi:tRNA nucleotidyltransferase/poly(A) polymerase